MPNVRGAKQHLSLYKPKQTAYTDYRLNINSKVTQLQLKSLQIHVLVY